MDKALWDKIEKFEADWTKCLYNKKVHEKYVQEYPNNGISLNDYEYHKNRLDRCYEWKFNCWKGYAFRTALFPSANGFTDCGDGKEKAQMKKHR